MESVGHIFMPAWGSSVATGVGVGRGAVFVGAALAAGFLGEGEAFGAEGAAAAFAGSGALEALGIGSPASIASIIEIYRAWTVLTFCAAVQTPPVDPLARTTSSSAIAPR